MLRTGEPLTRRGLADPWAQGGGGGPRAPREGITRARLRRALGVAAARVRSASAGVADEPCGLLHGEGRGAERRGAAPQVSHPPLKLSLTKMVAESCVLAQLLYMFSLSAISGSSDV